jgi:CxxC motif-containing protein (DUF1111 family)
MDLPTMTAHPFRALLNRASVLCAAVALSAVAFWMLKPSSSLAAQPAAPALGEPIANLTPAEETMFNAGEVPMAQTWTFARGLGPVFTQDSCQTCHASPVISGNSTQKTTLFGTLNSDGTFNPLTNEGGMFLQPNSVSQFHPNCVLAGETVPSNATIVAQHQAPQAFGMGLIDSIPGSSILAQAVSKGLGIQGTANMVPDQNGNTVVGKFGYKAQFGTLLQTVAEAMVHDIGITNPIVPAEDLPQGNPIPKNCSITTEPNDNGTEMMNAFHYELYLAPSPPGNLNQNGQALFTSVGCALCHLPSYTTGPNIQVPATWGGKIFLSKALSSQTVNLYSDLLLHDMGSVLADGLPLGLATGSMFRTTPLWGLSTRIANGNGLLHNGRTTSVTTAILDHGGEAQQVIGQFQALSGPDQADLISFISSL